MANVLVQDTSLTAIADAIREKNGSTDTYKPGEMAAAISEISVGSAAVVEELNITSNGTYTVPEGVDGYSPVVVNVPQGGAPSAEALKVSGNCSSRFAYNGWNKLIEDYGNQITTENITNAQSMFLNSNNLTSIPFEINVADKTSCYQMFYGCKNMITAPKINGKIGSADSMFSSANKLENIPDIECDNSTHYGSNYIFQNCFNLKELPYLYNFYPEGLNSMFHSCYNLREIPEDWVDTWNFNRAHTYTYAYSGASMFYYCYSLRKIPKKFLDNFGGKTTTSYYGMYSNTFSHCCSLDEVLNIPILDTAYTGNMFASPFYNSCRLKNITFAMNEDGTPKTANWKSQTIDLTTMVGYVAVESYKKYILDYNSGITADKEVKDDATYQALKNDPDWFTCDKYYSRYNHDSAVATINSLPDTSAYLAEKGGTNTIKFLSTSGSLTDGGAINTLTEEEIAVATAKGWTITLV